MTDLELARRIAAGDHAATEWMVRTHHASLFRFLRQLTRRPEEAEDLVQQALLRASQKADRFDGRASFRTWLHRIAYREYLNWRRSQRWHLNLLAAPPTQDPGHDRVVAAECLRGALAKLSEAQRAAFVLSAVQELSIEEIATITGVPVGTVKSRLFHARRHLQTLLADPQEEKKLATESI